MSETVPEFIKQRGCINCSAYQGWRDARKATTDVKLHELMTRCLLLGCTGSGYSVLSPFVHPDELDRFVVQRGSVVTEVQKAKEYREQVISKFGALTIGEVEQ